MTAYDRKIVSITTSVKSEITLQVDVDGTGVWMPYKTFKASPDEDVIHEFPEGFSAYWIRAVSDKDCKATVQFEYR